MSSITWAWSNDKTLWLAQHELEDARTRTSLSQTGRTQGESHEDQGDIAKGLELAIQAAVRCAAR